MDNEAKIGRSQEPQEVHTETDGVIPDFQYKPQGVLSSLLRQGLVGFAKRFVEAASLLAISVGTVIYSKSVGALPEETGRNALISTMVAAIVGEFIIRRHPTKN